MSSTHQQPLRIAIVGGGPGGLTLANILQRKAQELELTCDHLPWQVTVYEAEPSGQARRQGGSLDLKHSGGLAAIAAAGLTNRFNDFARPEGQETTIISRGGEVIFHKADSPETTSEAYHPEIDRADLNDILHEALDDKTIHWGHKLIDAQQQDKTGEYTLQFTNGKTATVDLVVGADGAWSRVRPLVTSEKPKYSGVPFLDWMIKDFDNRFPELVDLVGQGTLFSYGQGKLLITQRNGYGVLRLYLGFHTPEDWGKTSEIALASSEQERARMLVETHYKEWDEKLQQLILAAGEPLDGDADVSPHDESKMTVRGLYALPTGIKWVNRRGATLMGDAAHLMSPCAGEGVNMAMMDALELAEAITSPLTAEGTTEDFKDAALNAVVDYETKMFARVEHPMEISARTLELLVTETECDWASVKKCFGRAVE